VNLADLNKLMKTVDNTDTLTFFWTSQTTTIRVENDEACSHGYKLNLLDLDSGKLSIADTVGQDVRGPGQLELNKIVKEDGVAQWQGGDDVGDKLILTCIGESCTRETIIRTPATARRWGRDSTGRVQPTVPSVVLQVSDLQRQAGALHQERLPVDHPLRKQHARRAQAVSQPMVDE
jgi:hypothetical protein